MEEFDNTINEIKEKLGEENSALISDELISLMTAHKAGCEQIDNQSKEISTLKQEKENLVTANSKLFQRIGFDDNKPAFSSEKSEEVTPVIDIGDIIKPNGDFV